jgi:hypothetical protein
MIFQKYKNWIIIGGILILVFIVYSMFFTKKDENDVLKTSVAKTSAEIVGSEILNALNQIESLELDRSIFSSPIYQSLKDRSQAIPPEPVGKTNPFDPIGYSVVETQNVNKESTSTVDQINKVINRPAETPSVI